MDDYSVNKNHKQQEISAVISCYTWFFYEDVLTLEQHHGKENRGGK